MKKLYVLLGLVSFLLGAVGAFLPILPTTPFLLLTAYCFGKGSERFDRWFRSTKLYHNHLEEYEKRRAMTLRTKGYILCYATVSLSVGFYFSKILYARIVIVAIGLIMYFYFIFRIKTIPADKKSLPCPEQPTKKH